MENSSYQKILNLALTIKNIVTNIVTEKISTHEEKTSSTQQKGHSYAGGTPQPIGQNIQAGTDNGYYARADHVHTVDFQNIQNTPNALNVVDDLNTNDGSSPLSAKQGKWLNDNKENISNKTTNITNSSTDTQYPSAKAVYDLDVGVKNDFHSFGNNNNTNYYIKFLRIVYSGSYSDSGVSFTIHQRSQPPTNITFTTQWDNTNQKYNIGNLYYDGYPRAIYVYRSAKNTFDFYINPGAWGTYGMSPIKTDKTRIGSSITVTKLSELSDSLPTSTTDNPLLQATLNPYYSPVSHTHSYISTAAGSVGVSNLANNAVTTDKIADSAVTNAKIADGTINGATKIATGSITAGRIADGAITTTLLGDGKVTTAKIADSAVTSAKIGSDIQVSGTNLLTGTQAFNSPAPSGSSLNGTYYGCNARYLKNTGSSYIDFAWSIPYEQLESNGYYTLSFWAKTTTAHDYVYTYFYAGNVNTKRIKSNTTVSGYSGNGSFGDGSTRFALSTEWKRYYVVYQLNSTALGTGNKSLTIRLSPNTSNPYDIYLAGVKFEKGTIPTEWSPHPNDKANSSHTHPDTQITWNGTNTKNSVSPLDMAMYEEFSANRLAYFPGNNITVEYSTNGGSTWTTHTASALEKTKIVTTSGSFYCGNNSTADYSKNQLRITFKLGETDATSLVYMNTRKLMLYLCTCNASGPKVQISTSTYKAPTTFTNVGNPMDVEGWSGWNSIPLGVTLGGYTGTQTNSSSTRIQYLRLTFTQTGGTGNLRVEKIRLFGETQWNVQSNLARNGHIYSYDESGNVAFPGTLTATKIINSSSNNTNILLGNGNTLAQSTFAPTSHASTGTGYGVGTSANYGHNKIIDDATKSTLTNGESLSAHMGYILNNQDVEYVVSTHTSSTSTWTGTCSKLRKLEAGTKIYYRLNQDPTTTDVTLNLTLADSTTTGAKNVYFGGTRLKNQYPKYAVIGMVYDGSNWIVINQYTNTNTVYTHPNSGVTAGTNYNGNQTPSFGGTFNIPKLTFNAQGHITASANSTVTVPSLPTSSTSAAGIVKLNNNINSTSTTEAATANAVKTAYDKGNHSHPYATSGHNHNGTYIKDDNETVTSTHMAEGAIVNYNVAPYAGIEYSKLSGVAPTNHNHSTWTEKQSYTNGNKKIHLYVNEQLRLCDLYWENVSAVTANTNLTIANDGWLTSTYRPSHIAIGGGSFAGITVVGTGGEIVYRIPVTINSNTIHGQAMWHY